MIKSMTGFGRAEEILDGKNISIEIKSVNHRYFEYSTRLPRAYNYLSEKLKSLVNQSISRGKVEVSMLVNNIDGNDTVIEVNKSVAENYVKALRDANGYLQIEDDLTLSSISRLPDIFTVTKTEVDEEKTWANIKSVAEKALANFIEMREIEGEKMAEDVTNRLLFIEESADFVDKISKETTFTYRDKLYAKIKEILEDKNFDDTRLITEAAIFSEKTAVDEETVRLKSHISQFRTMLKSKEAIGRKLDFLVQELNREVNTIGSKSQNIEITNRVVDLKSEIEKIREQIQNIE